MNNMWDQRFGNTEYAYGEKPNAFIKKEISKIKPGKALFPAEGEGRNAVYTATQGWEVTAFDPSTEGKKKAKLLAAKNKVNIEYIIAGYEDIDLPKDYFDCIVLVFAHMPPLKRREYHQKLVSFLKPGGKLILQGFSKKQLGKKSGGPQNLDILFSKEELAGDFSELSELEITETETQLNEGPFHQGKAALIQVLGTK